MITDNVEVLKKYLREFPWLWAIRRNWDLIEGINAVRLTGTEQLFIHLTLPGELWTNTTAPRGTASVKRVDMIHAPDSHSRNNAANMYLSIESIGPGHHLTNILRVQKDRNQPERLWILKPPEDKTWFEMLREIREALEGKRVNECFFSLDDLKRA